MNVATHGPTHPATYVVRRATLASCCQMFVGWAGLVQYTAIVGVQIIYSMMFSYRTKFGNRLLSVSAVIGGGVIDLVRSVHLFHSRPEGGHR